MCETVYIRLSLLTAISFYLPLNEFPASMKECCSGPCLIQMRGCSGCVMWQLPMLMNLSHLCAFAVSCPYSYLVWSQSSSAEGQVSCSPVQPSLFLFCGLFINWSGALVSLALLYYPPLWGLFLFLEVQSCQWHQHLVLDIEFRNKKSTSSNLVLSQNCLYMVLYVSIKAIESID